MVGLMDITPVPQEYDQSLHQPITRHHHIQVGFSVVVGVELQIPGCTLMVAGHVVHLLRVFVNLHYDG